MLRRVWKTVEAKVEKSRMAETKGRRIERESRKEDRGKITEEIKGKAEIVKRVKVWVRGDKNNDVNGGVGNLRRKRRGERI